jgi:hypothetical protein
MSKLSANDFTEAARILQAFMDASLRQDDAAMRACVTRRTLESGQLSASGAPEGIRFVLDAPHMEGEQMVILARGFPIDAPVGTSPAIEMPCLMAKENGQWKFDLSGSAERMMGGISNVVEHMTQAMGEAMKGIGQAMADGLQQAFGQTAPEAPPQEQDRNAAKPTKAAKAKKAAKSKKTPMQGI